MSIQGLKDLKGINDHVCVSFAPLLTYLTVVEDLIDGLRNKEDLSTVTPDHKQETISRLDMTAHK